MSLIQQHEEVAKEISKYYSFHSRIRRRNAFRTLIPTNYLKVVYMYIYFCTNCFSDDKANVTFNTFRKGLDLFCSESEKRNPYYNIVYSAPYPIHALSEHLESKFPSFDWPTVEAINQLRLNSIPRVNIFGLPTAIIPVVSVINFDKMVGHLQNQLHDIWLVYAFAMSINVILVILVVLFQFSYKRMRFQRTGNVLKYITICIGNKRSPPSEANLRTLDT